MAELLLAKKRLMNLSENNTDVVQSSTKQILSAFGVFFLFVCYNKHSAANISVSLSHIPVPHGK